MNHNSENVAPVKSPSHFKFQDWKNILRRSKDQISRDNLGIVSAGVAFYAFLGIFPLLAAFISIYGMVASPSDVESLMASAEGFVPEEILGIFSSQLSRLAGENQVASWAAAISILVALWTGSKAVKGMMAALNIAFDEREDRNFFEKNGMALLLTLGGILVGMVCVFLLAALPVLVSMLNLGGFASTALQIVRWSLLAVVIISTLSVMYKWAPNRKGVKWRWITPGSSIAAIVWLAASGLFSWYVSNFGNYNKTYGSLGTIAILLLWLSLSAFVFILGAEMDFEMEREAGLNEKDGKKKQVT